MPEIDPRIHALRAGDPLAWSASFAEIWRVALAAVHGRCRRLSESDCEDAAADALGDVAEQVWAVRTWAELIRFVAAIARCRAVSLVRWKATRRRSSGLPDEPLDADGSLTDGEVPKLLAGQVVDRELGLGDLRRLLDMVLSTLDAETRCFLLEYAAEGRTLREIGARYGVPHGTVCSRVFRALHGLRALLSRVHSEFAAEDLRDVSGLAAKWRHPVDGVSRYFREQLAAGVRFGLSRWNGRLAVPRVLRAAMLRELNGVVAGQCFWNEARFEGIALRTETRELIGSASSGDRLALLNKLLLEDAYPDVLARHPLDELRWSLP